MDRYLTKSSFQNFNPRSHEGSDIAGSVILKILLFISIHAPTRGATYTLNCSTNALRNFNPRSHEGSDCNSKRKGQNCNYFNPRSHEGSDCEICTKYLWIQISIHAPTRGATHVQNIFELSDEISIHAPTRGATM